MSEQTNTRAKFHCNSMRKYESWIWQGATHTTGWAYEYEFQAVAEDTEENKRFFASTPNGTLKLTAVRDDLFLPGKDYYLDFSPVPPAPPPAAAEVMAASS